MTWGFECDQRNLKFETGKMEGVKGETDVMEKKKLLQNLCEGWKGLLRAVGCWSSWGQAMTRGRLCWTFMYKEGKEGALVAYDIA